MSTLKRNVQVHLRVTHLLVNGTLGIQPQRGKLGTQTLSYRGEGKGCFACPASFSSFCDVFSFYQNKGRAGPQATSLDLPLV